MVGSNRCCVLTTSNPPSNHRHPPLQLLDLKARLYNPSKLRSTKIDRDYIVSIYKQFVDVMNINELSTENLARWVGSTSA